MHLVKQLRHDQGWSQRELARRVGCSGPHISDIENGKVLPSIWILHRIAQVLNVSDATLFLDSIADVPDTARWPE
jgi:transcriptional regulator with XRE-family HTH domain